MRGAVAFRGGDLLREQNMKTKFIVAALALAATASVQAADWYVGGSLGRSDYKVDTTGATSSDKTDTGYKLFVGARLSPNFAVEGGYADLGKATASDATSSAKLKLSALPYVDAVGFLPLSPQWDLLGRFGLTSSKLKVSGTNGGVSASDSDRSIQAHFGFGAQYNISKTMAVRAEWERFRGKYDKNGVSDSGNVDLLSVGIAIGF
jgi:OOP family OmpA-OmpF porin